MAFVENLRLIQFPRGMFDRAVALARSRPLPADEISPGFARFKPLCQALQELHGSHPFILSVERFGEALGVCRESITHYKKRAQREGWLQLASGPIPLKRAGRFRFINPSISREGSGGIWTGLEGRNTGRGAGAMLSAFASVGARAFDMTVTNIEGEKVEGKYRGNRSLEELRRTIERAAGGRARSAQRHHSPAIDNRPLIQLDDLERRRPSG